MNTCARCATNLPDLDGRGRPAKFCGKTCSRAHSKANNQRFCEIAGCGKRHVAKGLCATHYNRTLPNRHRKVVYTCSACGGPAIKDAGRDKRHAKLYCSDLCKNYARWGGCSTKLPANHPARWYGSTSEWVSPLTRNTGECEWCGNANQRSQRAAFCSPYCKEKAKHVRRIARQHNTVGTYTWAQIVRLWIGMGKRCAYCDERTPLHMIQAEHVIPLSRGGENHIGNILPSCGPCNSDKRDLYLHEWNADRLRRGLNPVRTSWPDTDPRFTHLTRTPVRLSA